MLPTSALCASPVVSLTCTASFHAPAFLSFTQAALEKKFGISMIVWPVLSAGLLLHQAHKEEE